MLVKMIRVRNRLQVLRNNNLNILWILNNNNNNIWNQPKKAKVGVLSMRNKLHNLCHYHLKLIAVYKIIIIMFNKQNLIFYKHIEKIKNIINNNTSLHKSNIINSNSSNYSNRLNKNKYKNSCKINWNSLNNNNKW